MIILDVHQGAQTDKHQIWNKCVKTAINIYQLMAHTVLQVAQPDKGL